MQTSVRGKLAIDEPMSRHCSWRTGGLAQRYFEPADRADLIAYLAHARHDEAYTWIGLGSNLLVRDGGLTGTVISTSKTLNGYEWINANRLYVECGTPCAKVAKEAVKNSVGGGGFLAGIPGTVGGALAMNAGAFGREIWMLVESVELLRRDGTIRQCDESEFSTSYRFVDVPEGHWFISAVLHFAENDTRDADNQIPKLLAKRGASQPTGQASCGSVFKNPAGDFAGRLIESAGLKGLRIGGCFVSNKHANFIINDRDASASDLESLILNIQREVAKSSGVTLEPEVRIVGRSASHEHPGG